MLFIKTLSYTSTTMPLISLINCKTKRKTKTYIFIPSIFNKSSFASNLSVFKNFNILQMGINKIDNQ